MKKLNFVVILITLSVLNSVALCSEDSMDWEQLKKHKVPEWFKDAKFGIYAHWGAYCVPAFGSEWYPRNMYRKESDVHEHHVKTWGDPSKFGYKDFIPMFKAEKFNADEWAQLYARAGAKFAGPVAWGRSATL
jgi:alpha-L-fucosidase